jgi:hypothetical protein
MPTATGTPETLTDRTHAVLVIGAGPAGLSAARALAGRGLDYDHVEKHDQIGGLWDVDAPGGPMYSTAHFNSSRTLSAFPGFPLDEDLPDYPRHDQILSYLREFADAYALTDRIQLGVGVDALEQEGDGSWTARFSNGESATYRAVVCCSGSQWHPNLPDVPGSFDGEIRHAMTYRDPSELRGKRVLVVGAGASGCDIASDAAMNADRAVISMRRGYWFIPKHIFGVPADVFGDRGPHLPMWLEQRIFARVLKVLTGDPRKYGLQVPDHKLFETHPVVNSTLLHHLQHGDLTARPGIASTDGRTVIFSDGSREEIDLILCATGYLHKVPYAQQYFGDEQHPDLYLSSFSRDHRNLFGIGFVETNAGAFPHFDISAQMIAAHLADQTDRPDKAAEFQRLIRSDRPDLSGGIKFDSSPRHQGYVNSPTLLAYQRKLMRRMGWGTAVDAPQHVGGKAMVGAR